MSNNSPSNLFDAATNVKILHQHCPQSPLDSGLWGRYRAGKLLFVSLLRQNWLLLKAGGVNGQWFMGGWVIMVKKGVVCAAAPCVTPLSKEPVVSCGPGPNGQWVTCSIKQTI